MAASSKKKVTKDDIRRLMKEKQSVIKNKTKKIEHPLAKYNSLDQLVCVLCNTVIKTDLLWTAHLVSRQHKQKLDEFKTSKAEPGSKRKSEDTDTGTAKKAKGPVNGSSAGVPSDFFDSGSSKAAKPLKSILTNSTKPILSQYDSSDSEEEEDDDIASNTTPQLTAGKPSLPPDFFDPGTMPGTSLSSNADTDKGKEKPSVISDALPEGFFDDPVMDAKVRKVEYVDKMEEEWELFQKSMKEETHVSEAIIEEEDEQVNVDRNIDEIDEQIQCWKEVNDLQNKKDEIMKNKKLDGKNDSDSEDELDEEKLEEFLDWRSKKSWR